MPRKKTDKVINKSRPVGSRKPGRPPKTPKTEPAPPASDWSETSSSQDWGAEFDKGMGTISLPGISPATPAFATSSAVTSAQPYTGVSQVSHGLSLPEFDCNNYFAPDLFSDSSSLPRTTKEQADEWIQGIEEKRQTVRVATANIQLNQDVVKAGNEYRKLEGFAIDYATTQQNNATKFVNYQTAGVNTDIALNKFAQANERLIQGQKTLTGMQSITPLIDQEWEARRSLKNSQISSLKIEATKAREALEPKLMQLSESFRQELDDVA